MRSRYTRIPVSLCALVLASCGDLFGPNGTEYRLVSIDGSHLPYHITYEDPTTGPDIPQYIIDRGGLSLHEDGRYDVLISGRHYSYFDRTWGTFRNSASGRYTIAGDTIRFYNEMGDVRSTSLPVGWFEDGRIRIPTEWFCTCEFTFEEIT